MFKFLQFLYNSGEIGKCDRQRTFKKRYLYSLIKSKRIAKVSRDRGSSNLKLEELSLS